MPESFKQIKNRIHSIENAKKVTAALEMVSFSKLNKTEKTLAFLRQYFLKLEQVYGHLLGEAQGLTHPFFEERSDNGKIALCLVTSDSGLCGAYNVNIISLAEKFLQEHVKERIVFVFVGKKGFNFFRKKGFLPLHAYLGLNGRYNQSTADEIANKLFEIFSCRLVDEVYVAYTHFESAFIHKPTIKKLLNLKKNIPQEVNFIFEPDKEMIAERFLRHYLIFNFRIMLLEAFASEHACRVIAMRSATDNAKEMLQQLTLARNKMRQASITQEIMEVISTAEALKG
ncbi:MAG: ATP synthase F1 subunit gamma [Candidatus Omnitrophica bacterium]|nr:ATP synthase F1 subunit gamma [Candidatus Omnitrophota bacterium]